jgi:hypothetical protein
MRTTVGELLDSLEGLERSVTVRLGEEGGDGLSLEGTSGEAGLAGVGAASGGGGGGTGAGQPARLSDDQALNAIQRILQDPDWDSGMLPDIREIVDDTGRSCEGDGAPTWDRH